VINIDAEFQHVLGYFRSNRYHPTERENKTFGGFLARVNGRVRTDTACRPPPHSERATSRYCLTWIYPDWSTGFGLVSYPRICLNLALAPSNKG